MNAAAQDAPDGIEPGRRLIRVGEDHGTSLAERIALQFHRLTWRTPLHTLRLRGRYPLKLLGVPRDPVEGDAAAGARLMQGYLTFGRESVDVETLDFAEMRPGGLTDHAQSFAWLRDLAAAGPRERGAPVAEYLMRRCSEHPHRPRQPRTAETAPARRDCAPVRHGVAGSPPPGVRLWRRPETSATGSRLPRLA